LLAERVVNIQKRCHTLSETHGGGGGEDKKWSEKFATQGEAAACTNHIHKEHAYRSKEENFIGLCQRGLCDVVDLARQIFRLMTHVGLFQKPIVFDIIVVLMRLLLGRPGHGKSVVVVD
jgi:hypothetical protein